MKPKEFMLYDQYDCIKYIFKVDTSSDNAAYLNGDLFEVVSWSDGEPYETGHIANLYLKWDGCTHWRFNEEEEIDIQGNYWHICGSSNLEEIRVMMAFIWKCAQVWMTKYIENPDANNDYKRFFDRHADALGNYKFVIRPSLDE